MKGTFLLLILLVVATNVEAESTLSGEVRTRSEWNSKSLKEGSGGFVSVSNRTRVVLKTKPSQESRLKISLQDNRYAGTDGVAPSSPYNSRSAQNATNNLNSLHIHEAYVDWEFWLATRLLVGRQEVKLGSQRFIGTDDWYSGLSFDGVKVDYQINSKQFLSSMFFAFANDVPRISKDSSVFLMGVFYELKYNQLLNTQLYTFYEKNKVDAVQDITNGTTDLIYLGERVFGEHGSWFYDQEFIFQVGKAGEVDVYAFNSFLRLGKKFQEHTATFGFDMMTGDDNNRKGSYKQYENKYATVHNLYGTMDYIESNLKEGVMDFRLDGKLKWKKGDIVFQMKPEFHLLLNSFADRFYGTEYDLGISSIISKKIKVSAGTGLFLPISNEHDNLFSSKGDGVGYYFYLMPTFRF